MLFSATTNSGRYTTAHHQTMTGAEKTQQKGANKSKWFMHGVHMFVHFNYLTCKAKINQGLKQRLLFLLSSVFFSGSSSSNKIRCAGESNSSNWSLRTAQKKVRIAKIKRIVEKGTMA